MLLPVGARLVHIGPSKTGTTSLQGSMWAAQAEMRRQGVRYLGQSRHSGLAARAIAGMSSPYADSGKPPAMRNWVASLRELRRAEEPRAVFSSEYLAHASRNAVEQVVGNLDPARIHVVVTLRPLPRHQAHPLLAGGAGAGRGRRPDGCRVWWPAPPWMSAPIQLRPWPTPRPGAPG